MGFAGWEGGCVVAAAFAGAGAGTERALAPVTLLSAGGALALAAGRGLALVAGDGGPGGVWLVRGERRLTLDAVDRLPWGGCACGAGVGGSLTSALFAGSGEGDKGGEGGATGVVVWVGDEGALVCGALPSRSARPTADAPKSSAKTAATGTQRAE